MKVKDLIKMLKKYDQEMEVVHLVGYHCDDSDTVLLEEEDIMTVKLTPKKWLDSYDEDANGKEYLEIG